MMKSNRWVIYAIMFVVITILLFFVIMWVNGKSQVPRPVTKSLR